MTGRPEREVPRVRVVLMVEDDWERVRAIRLSALATDPRAFGSTLAREEGLDEADWRARIVRARWLVAVIGDRDAAVTALLPHADEPRVFSVIGVWVAPAFRGRGVGDSLIRAAIDAARALSARRLDLRLAEGNGHAERLYARHGFVRIDRAEAGGDASPEVEMRLVLG